MTPPDPTLAALRAELVALGMPKTAAVLKAQWARPGVYSHPLPTPEGLHITAGPNGNGWHVTASRTVHRDHCEYDTHVARRRRPTATEALRAAVEAVWPDPSTRPGREG